MTEELKAALLDLFRSPSPSPTLKHTGALVQGKPPAWVTETIKGSGTNWLGEAVCELPLKMAKAGMESW